MCLSPLPALSSFFSRSGETGLRCAAADKSVDVALAILARPDFTAINVSDRGGRTALHIAARAGLKEVCAAILQRPGFNGVNAKDRGKWSALHHAAHIGSAPVCEALLAYRPAKPEDRLVLTNENERGMTPADVAETRNHLAAATLIREAERQYGITQKSRFRSGSIPAGTRGLAMLQKGNEQALGGSSSGVFR